MTICGFCERPMSGEQCDYCLAIMNEPVLDMPDEVREHDLNHIAERVAIQGAMAKFCENQNEKPPRAADLAGWIVTQVIDKLPGHFSTWSNRKAHTRTYRIFRPIPRDVLVPVLEEILT